MSQSSSSSASEPGSAIASTPLLVGADESKHEFDSLYVPTDDTKRSPPVLDGLQYLLNGEVKKWTGKSTKVHSPLYHRGSNTPIVIGESPLMSESDALAAVQSCSAAWANGRGKWALMHVRDRILAVENFVSGLLAKKKEIVDLLMWEICKNEDDSKKEFDRTIAYVKDTIAELKKMENSQSTFEVTGGVIGQIRRAPLGVVLCLGPFNYPFNETYTTLIPALIMGNSVILKLPKVGNLCHTPTLEVFAKCFPPGVINTIAGSGRATMPAIMQSGKVDLFAFIGTNKGANNMIKHHPTPHKLRLCLGLDAKNPAIVLKSADLDVAVSECVLGSLSFNGQRCTALKILFVQESIIDAFIAKFAAAVDALKLGLPWDTAVKITPIAEPEKPQYLKEIISDALAKGAKIVNSKGGRFDRSFVAPTVLFPVTRSMRLFHEEQFSPVVPIAKFREVSEIYDYLSESQYGQQASVFGQDRDEIAALVDCLVNQVSRVNLNCQCQRGPDTFPFTGRKNSAYGTLSVYDALRVFSIRALVATKEHVGNEEVLNDILKKNQSNFLRMDFMF